MDTILNISVFCKWFLYYNFAKIFIKKKYNYLHLILSRKFKIDFLVKSS